MQSRVSAIGEEDLDAAIVLGHALVIIGGVLVGCQAASLLGSGLQARAADRGQPVSEWLPMMRGTVLFLAAVGPLATAFAMTGATQDRRRGLEVLNTVAGLYVYAALRDFINELLPRHLLLELADYGSAGRMDAPSVLRQRGTAIMAASLVPNSLAALADKLVLQPALQDVVLAAAITRGLYAFINEIVRGLAASRDGANGTVRPVPVARLPRPSLKGWAEESAMRIALAEPAQALNGLGNLMGDDTVINLLAHFLVISMGCAASAVSEFRGLLVQFGRLGQLLEAAPVDGLPPPDAGLADVEAGANAQAASRAGDASDVVTIHAGAVDLQRPVSFHFAPVERVRRPDIYL
jgi:hypothetical protein